MKFLVAIICFLLAGVSVHGNGITRARFINPGLGVGGCAAPAVGLGAYGVGGCAAPAVGLGAYGVGAAQLTTTTYQQQFLATPACGATAVGLGAYGVNNFGAYGVGVNRFGVGAYGVGVNRFAVGAGYYRPRIGFGLFRPFGGVFRPRLFR